jgi:hypothetical protein
MSVSIRLRKDTATNWSTNNPALHQGELGLDLTNKKIKVGDGFTSWNSLEFLEEAGLNQIRTEYGDEVSFQIHMDLNKV